MGASGAVMAVAVLGCLGALAQRRWAKNRARKAWLSRPGYSPENPVVVSRFDEMDHFVHGQRCLCGGSCITRTEGSLSFGTLALRVVRGECDRCEEEMAFFFELPEIEH